MRGDAVCVGDKHYEAADGVVLRLVEVRLQFVRVQGSSLHERARALVLTVPPLEAVSVDSARNVEIIVVELKMLVSNVVAPLPGVET